MIPALLAPLLLPVAHAADAEFPVEPLVPTGNPAHGDYQWNHAFRLAKARRQNPRALAESMLPGLVGPAIRKAEVAGPGFINLHLDDVWLAQTLGELLVDPRLGIAQEGAGRRMVLDYSSPNVAKRMHIGHMRSTHIGHALYRMYQACGWEVVGDNHIGDWGTQFGKLIVAWQLWRDAAAYAADAIGELERIYVKFGEEAERDPTLIERARAETAGLQRGDEANTALWRQFIAVSLAEFEAVYRRMGVRFDVMLGESAYRAETDDIVAQLVEAGIAERSEGALLVRFPEGPLHDHPMIVQKRDGAANYATTDLACLRYRVRTWNPDRIVIVTDMRQQLHFQQFFSVGRSWGIAAELVHCWFGMLVLPEGAMSTRSGNVIRLVDLFDEAVARARAVVDAKSPHLSDEERGAIAEAVGVGAVRYADLSQNPQTNVTFSWEKMLSLEGNTAPYLLYSHARAASLLAKAGGAPPTGRITLGHPLERELALALLRYPEAVQTAASSYRPNLLAEHLYDIANRFNRFYHELPVLTGGDARESRLALVGASRQVLKHGMELLGLVVLDRM
jgi:arginyl-tRNA synthetase